ncbi:helix-turn-helix domain-containing protein [Bradyrhizobium sp. WSM1743]|uniref:helix-turn-helix domain-containing protein n=1 Tax=Bradyrhizobium sp. WSM1743 TaxID=318996 RepID=UPI001FDA7934|nr:helix-turn-helix transcriptional regulator [Bradyrhizobium sp. WSM1743]
MRRLLLLDPDPDVAAEIRVALPLDLDQDIGDAGLLVRRAGKVPMTVKRLADALGLSERTLNRKFQELTHEPAQSFLMRRRVEHARTLLESTTQPIKTIARAAGYEDESSFRKAFRKLTSMSPQAYRTRRTEQTM